MLALLVVTHVSERELRVRALDPEGRLLGGMGGGLDLYLEDPGTGRCVGMQNGSDNDGYMRITQQHADSVLIVRSPGCRVLRIPNPEKRQEVQLEYGIPVDLTVVSTEPLPEAPLSLELKFTRTDGRDYAKHAFVVAGKAWFDSPHVFRAARLVVPATRRLHVWVPAPGSYEIEWMIREGHDVREPGHMSLGDRWHGAGRNDSMTVVIEDRGRQAFKFPIDQDLLASIRATLK